MKAVLTVDQPEDGQMTSGLTGMAFRWRNAFKQQGADNNEGHWFTP